MRKEPNKSSTGSSAFEAQRLAAEGERLTPQQLKAYLPLVQSALEQIGGYLPPDIEPETLRGKILLALGEASEDQPTNSTRFVPYARLRLWRALVDYLLQSRCFLPHTCTCLQELRQVTDEALRRGQETKDEEIQALLGGPVAELRQDLEQLASLLAILPQTVLALAKNDYAGPAERRLAEAISNLPQTEQLVVAMYYFDDMDFPEIAEALEISEQEVQGAFGQATVLLRIELGGQSPGDREGESN